jgi:hypothetical protein
LRKRSGSDAVGDAVQASVRKRKIAAPVLVFAQRRFYATCAMRTNGEDRCRAKFTL